MSNKENTDTKTRKYENFDFRAWKTDDKTWMKERRLNWPKIKETLDHINLTYRHTFRDKKPFKYIKQFYLTGQVDFPELVGEINHFRTIINMNSPLDKFDIGGSIGGLLECWLTPEPTEKKWEQIFERYESRWLKRNEPENIGKQLEESKVCFRESIIHWYTKDDQLNLFGDLENELTAFFKPFPSTDNYDFYWAELMPIYLNTCGWKAETQVYNPKNPIYEKVDECIQTLVPYYSHKTNQIKEYYTSEREFKYYSKKNLKEFSELFSFISDISQSYDSYGDKQVSFAKEFLNGIEKLDLPDDLALVFREVEKNN